MTTQAREVIQTNKTLLLKNIIPCKELIDKITELNVIPETQLNEIKDKDASDKVTVMLEFIAFRGGQVAVKFCDALQLSGHNFVADFLREELTNEKTNEQATDITRKFPKLEKLVNDKEKEELAAYLNEKLKEQSLRQMWRGAAKEKEKAIDAKQRQLEEAWKFKEILDEKDEEIENLTSLIESLNKESDDKSQALQNLNSYMEETKSKHKNQMAAQMQYNVANDKSLSRLNERQSDMQKLISEINVSLHDLLVQKGFQSNADADSDIISLTNSHGDVIKQHIKDIGKVFDDMNALKKYTSELEDERNYVLVQIHGAKHNSKEKQSLVESFRDFIVNKEEIITGLKTEIESLKQALLEKEGKEHSEETVNTLETTIEDLKGNLNHANNKISDLEKENKDLKGKLEELKKAAEEEKEEENKRRHVIETPQAHLNPGVWFSGAGSDSRMSSEYKVLTRHIEEPPAGVLQYSDPRNTNGVVQFGNTPNLVQPVRASPAFKIKVEQKPIYMQEKDSGKYGVTFPPLNGEEPQTRRIPSLTGGSGKSPNFLEPPKPPPNLKAQKSVSLTQTPRKK